MYELLACGSNGESQLGVGDTTDRHNVTKVQFMVGNEQVTVLRQPIRQIACGGDHTIAILEDGTLFGCGSNTRGQLFSQGGGHFPVFRAIESLAEFKFKHAVCGWEFSLAVTEDDKIFVSGYGGNGELGLGRGVQKIEGTYQEILLPGKVSKIKSSIHSTIAQLDNGELWCWGNNKKGQLFDHDGDRQRKIVWKPQKLELDDPCRDFALGRNFTVLILQKENTLQPILRGEDHFELEAQLSIPLEQNSFDRIDSMWSSVHIVTRNHTISFAGNNSHCQQYPTKAATLDPIDTYCVGSEHGLCVTSDSRKVFAWGWGEHGNCGTQQTNSVVFDHLNPLFETTTGTVKQVFAGCATSFVEVETAK